MKTTLHLLLTLISMLLAGPAALSAGEPAAWTDTVQVAGTRIDLPTPGPRAQHYPMSGSNRWVRASRVQRHGTLGGSIQDLIDGIPVNNFRMVITQHDPSFLSRDGRLIGRAHLRNMELFDSFGREFRADPDPDSWGGFTPRYAQGGGGVVLLHWWHP
jgi:hypothetical protein